MGMIDDQLERCKETVSRLLGAMSVTATGDTKVEIAKHELDDLEVCLENLEMILQEDRPRDGGVTLVDFVAAKRGCDKSQARRLIVEGQVEVNLKKVTSTGFRLSSGELVEIFNETRQIFQPWQVD